MTMQEVHRLDADGPVRVRMSDLRKGDRFTMSGYPHEVMTAQSDPVVNDDGVATVNALVALLLPAAEEVG